MATKKTYDLAVKTGEYEKDGQTKNRYVNIGMILEKDDGGKFILLNRHFNPAGVPFNEGKETIMVSMFAANKESREDTPPPDGDIPF